MYLARYENFYSHPGSKVVKDSRGRKKYVTERMNWRHVLDGNGNLQGTGIGNVFARRTYLSAMYQKNKAPVKWLNGWRNVLPWDKRVRIGDIVANMRKDGKIFHVGTVVFSDPRLRIAAVVESYLRKDNKGKILKTPTNLWVYYDKTNNRSPVPRICRSWFRRTQSSLSHIFTSPKSLWCLRFENWQIQGSAERTTFGTRSLKVLRL